ncbi:Potassium transporter 10 [Hordeum vulgare]|nr:Potassium transporter 10 [Hordeum vulgare]
MKGSPAMDPEAAVARGTPPENTEGRQGEGKKWLPWQMTLSLAYQSLGVVWISALRQVFEAIDQGGE